MEPMLGALEREAETALERLAARDLELDVTLVPEVPAVKGKDDMDMCELAYGEVMDVSKLESSCLTPLSELPNAGGLRSVVKSSCPGW